MFSKKRKAPDYALHIIECFKFKILQIQPVYIRFNKLIPNHPLMIPRHIKLRNIVT